MNCEVDQGAIGRALNSGVAATLLGAALLTLSACAQKAERPAPATYPVTGTVVVASGSPPAGGSVEFKPRENEDELTATGVIGADGKFSLSIPFVDRKIPGATAGPHRVFVVMPLGANRKGGGYIPIKGDFTVKAAENKFTITLPSE